MTTEIIKGVIAIIIILTSIVSILIGDTVAQATLVPLATFVFGYYFKQSIETPIIKRITAIRKKQ